MTAGARKAKKKIAPGRKKKKERLRPVSLHPLDFDTAIKRLVVMAKPARARKKLGTQK